MRYVSLMEPSWGAEYPKWTNLGVIAIAYAVIAPLVLGFATIGIGMLYLAYRYNMLYVYNTQIDTKGAFYARALEQLMVGVYLAEFCLLGLFGIGIGSALSAIGPTVILVVLIATTIIFHVIVKMKLKPLFTTLPLEEVPSPSENDSGNGYSEKGLFSDLPSGRETNEYGTPGRLTTDLNRHEKEPFYEKIFTLRQPTARQISASLAPHFRQAVPAYTKQEVMEAYLHPALNQKQPVVWLARDRAGMSGKECEKLSQSIGQYGVEVTDHGAEMNEKGKVEWVDQSVTEAPLWKRKIVY